MDNDDPLIIKTSIHSLEHRIGDEKVDFLDMQIDMGYDLKKLVFKTHIEKGEEELEKAETRLSYSFATSPYWNFQLGIRKDFEENGKDYLSIGIDGLYPYYINTEAVLFIATDGLVEARLALEHEIMVTQKVMFMLGVEADVFSQDINDAGFAKSEAFIKLMYGITKKIIPYIGIHTENKYFTKDEVSDENSNVFYTIGLHAWF
jgi:copper resistance protein B